ncbi:ABC transporter permease [Natranaerobius thermophilus]|uniref:Binding-protein-dependent transport systems inner membrane component n=1 Tax=Natranaerobius thermophilus (strain ATCC BAA-1301 / DSM 18059 / JW/NM-WN-LF) TaxID=457570 RepID=B2A3U3_NATTJ|nr:ABC transporter permease [Natranaerobius thermophilus]ACB83719.1 binding-protein-dependent transport systems inner membrane component [Natranaerobius thermophilus JW/NM-WN-LF]
MTVNKNTKSELNHRQVEIQDKGESRTRSRQIKVILTKYSHILIPILYITLGTVYTVINVQNPVDSLAEGWLSYERIGGLLYEHIILVGLATLGAILTSVPLGILITRPTFRWLTPFVDNPVNVGQTVPSIAILGLAYYFMGTGLLTALFALWLYSLLPILRNTSIGIKSVDPEILEAARGMGMTPYRIFIKIEFPLALPVIMAGIRTSVVICTGAATLATFIGAGALGEIINAGLSMRRIQLVYQGAVLAALFALLLDNLIGTLERYLTQEAYDEDEVDEN